MGVKKYFKYTNCVNLRCAMHRFHLVKHKRWVSFNAHWGWKWTHRQRLCSYTYTYTVHTHTAAFKIDNSKWWMTRERDESERENERWKNQRLLVAHTSRLDYMNIHIAHQSRHQNIRCIFYVDKTYAYIAVRWFASSTHSFIDRPTDRALCVWIILYWMFCVVWLCYYSIWMCQTIDVVTILGTCMFRFLDAIFE